MLKILKIRRTQSIKIILIMIIFLFIFNCYKVSNKAKYLDDYDNTLKDFHTHHSQKMESQKSPSFIRLSQTSLNNNQVYLDKQLDKLYINYKQYTSISSNQLDKIVELNSRNKNQLQKQFYLIVEYTPVFGNTKYCEKRIKSKITSKEDFILKKLIEQTSNFAEDYSLLDKCVFNNCYFTCDKSHTDTADALLFHEADLIESISKGNSGVIPKKTQNQVWILWNDEANRVDKRLDFYNFNWTISYKSDSEISYGAYGLFEKNKNIEPGNANSYNLFVKTIQNEFYHRANHSIWFNSNCGSIYRIQFATSLGTNFPLTVFGSCNKHLPENMQNSTQCKRDSDCEGITLKSNKFYLAFESKNCTDYITEKFWRSLAFGLIPIVIQPNKEYYERVAPKNSFIHAEDFNYDAEKLSKHLEIVSNNFEEYLKYFNWKYEYDVLFNYSLEKIRMCELCHKLNTETHGMYYRSVSNFFNSECVIN